MPGEEKTLGGGAPAAANAAENNSAGSGQDDDIDTDIEEIIKKEIPDEDDDDDDDTVVVPKKKMETLKANLKNYKTGLVSLKDKYIKKGGEKGNPANNKDSAAKDHKSTVSDDDTPITKGEQRKEIEVTAIAKACEDEVINKNWVEIIKFYTPRHGRDSVEAQLKNIREAKTLWEKEQAEKADKKDGDEGDGHKTEAELAADKARIAGTGAKGDEKKGAKHIIPSRTGVKDWYPKPDKK